MPKICIFLIDSLNFFFMENLITHQRYIIVAVYYLYSHHQSSTPIKKLWRPSQENRYHWFLTHFFRFFFSFVSDSIEPDFFRKVKDKRPSAGSTAGQILPVISDKSSHVTQVQGSRQDQIGNLRIKQRCARTAGEKTPPLPASSDDICQFGVQHLLHSAVLKQFS